MTKASFSIIGLSHHSIIFKPIYTFCCKTPYSLSEHFLVDLKPKFLSLFGKSFSGKVYTQINVFLFFLHPIAFLFVLCMLRVLANTHPHNYIWGGKLGVMFFDLNETITFVDRWKLFTFSIYFLFTYNMFI